MKNNEEVKNIKEKIAPILKKYKVTKAGIFGSFARGEQNKKSDVDVLVEMEVGLDLFDIANLKYLIEKKIKRKVDLVEYACIRKEIKEGVLNDEIPIL